MAGLPDHEREAEDFRRRVWKEMTPARKWEEFNRLQAFARTVKRAGIQYRNPELTAPEVEIRLREAFLYARA